MLKRTMGIATFLCFSFGCHPSKEQPLSQEPPIASSPVTSNTTTIPFTLTEFNNISIPATIDDKYAVNLMFHTGVSDVSLTAEATERLSDLKLDQTMTVNSWGGESNPRFGDNFSLRIGELQWQGIRIFGSELSGKQTDGKFGKDLFQGKILELDFDQCLLNVHDTLPSIPAGFKKMGLNTKDGLMFVEAEIEVGDAKYRNEFMVHSGFSGTMLLDDEFVEANQLADQLVTTSETDLKDSYGNIIKTRKVSVPSITIGDTSIKDVSIGLFDASLKRQKLSVLGGELLKRFNIILDIEQSSIYLKPNGRSEA